MIRVDKLLTLQEASTLTEQTADGPNSIEFLQLYRKSSQPKKRILEKILLGFASGRLEIPYREALHFTVEDWEELADGLPDESLSDWTAVDRPS